MYKLSPKVSKDATEISSYLTFRFKVMSGIRMIKLFGWEGRTAAQLDQKREEELVVVRKTKILTACIGLCK